MRKRSEILTNLRLALSLCQVAVIFANMALSLSRRLLKVNNLRALQAVGSRNYADAASGLQLTFGTPTKVN